ncbi:hypothetical protein HEM35_022625 [Escherichia coli]|nr:hypothetical protein [Escherichia coli]HCQ8741823.1 hypothetical protein [Escherichia coli]
MRLAWNEAAAISDLSVLCGGWNGMAGSACGFIGPDLDQWQDLRQRRRMSAVLSCILQVIDFTELTQREEVDDSPINPFLDFLALFRCLVKI